MTFIRGIKKALNEIFPDPKERAKYTAEEMTSWEGLGQFGSLKTGIVVRVTYKHNNFSKNWYFHTREKKSIQGIRNRIKGRRNVRSAFRK